MTATARQASRRQERRSGFAVGEIPKTPEQRMRSIGQARSVLKAARASYRRDMRWLQRAFGIVQEAEPNAVRELAQAALDALTTGDLPSLRAAVVSFEAYHMSLLACVAWDLLEQTKRTLKQIRARDPEGFARKHPLWIQATWQFSHGRSGGQISGYRNSIRITAGI